MYNPKRVFKKPYKWQRQLVEHAFSGTDGEGRRLGVYIKEKDGEWDFEIRGILENTLLSLPLTDEYLIEAFNIDGDYKEEEDSELMKIRKLIETKSALH